MAGTAYVVGLWLVATDAEIRGGNNVTPQAMASLAIVVMVPILAHFAGQYLRRFFAEPQELSERTEPVMANLAMGGGESGPVPAPRPSQPVNLTALMHGVWIILIIVAGGLTARLWGFDPTGQTGLGSVTVRVETSTDDHAAVFGAAAEAIGDMVQELVPER